MKKSHIPGWQKLNLNLHLSRHTDINKNSQKPFPAIQFKPQISIELNNKKITHTPGWQKLNLNFHLNRHTDINKNSQKPFPRIQFKPQISIELNNKKSLIRQGGKS